MKTTLNAIEKTLPTGTRLIAIAGSGFLRAVMYESENGCQFNIYREDPETGEIGTRFQSGDVEHLARLTAIVANALFRTRADGSADDLGCLAHCLCDALCFDINEFWKAETDGTVQ